MYEGYTSLTKELHCTYTDVPIEPQKKRGHIKRTYEYTQRNVDIYNVCTSTQKNVDI